MKKLIIVSMLVLTMICGLSTVVRAADEIDIEDYQTIPDEEPTKTTTPEPEPEPTKTTTPEPTKEENTTTTSTTDNSVAKTKNPQTGVKEEAPIIIVTILGICVAIYAGRKIKKYNY